MPLLAALKKYFSPTDLRSQPEILRRGVCESYSLAATKPGSRHPFPCGEEFALDLGYPKDLLATFPKSTLASFVGVSNVSLFAKLEPGNTVLDLGCGAGLDALIAARRVGPNGRVTGIDFSRAMLTQARLAAAETGLTNLEFICGEAERLPLADSSVDIVLINGIFNLNTDRQAIFAEIARVTRPGGLVYAAELLLTGPLPQKRLRRLDDWFS